MEWQVQRWGLKPGIDESTQGECVALKEINQDKTLRNVSSSLKIRNLGRLIRNEQGRDERGKREDSW